jgi:outer membrane lipoprotein-sorting protein
MKIVRRFGCAAIFILPLFIGGCSLLPTKRHLPVPKAPAIVLSATPQDLVNQLDQRWDALNTLTATVQIQATEFKTTQGLEKDFPSCRGYILMRKPRMLRVAGTYFGVPIFNMASDGTRFTLVIPSKNLAIEGANTVKDKNPDSPLLNLRPDFFLDAIAVRSLASDDEYMMVNDTETVEDAAKKHLYEEPEYVLTVMRPKAGKEITPIRVITFRRDDMLPYNQDIYDSAGNLETQVIYSNYALFTAGKYPSRVTIKRPKEGIQLVLTVVDVKENIDLSDSQFQVKIPEGTTIRRLK